MPVWLSILLGIIGGLGTLGGVLGITAYFSERAKHKADLKNTKEDEQRLELGQMRHNKYKQELTEIIKKEMSPIQEDLKEIKEDLELNKKATITSLRSNMKVLRDKYKEQGYADAGDKATWAELFDDYKDMGGNHFKEFVNQWKEEVDELPLDKKGHKTKQRLVENKKKKEK